MDSELFNNNMYVCVRAFVDVGRREAKQKKSIQDVVMGRKAFQKFHGKGMLGKN